MPPIQITVWSVTKPLPVIVTGVPPVTGPDVGVSEANVGGATYW